MILPVKVIGGSVGSGLKVVPVKLFSFPLWYMHFFLFVFLVLVCLFIFSPLACFPLFPIF